MKKYLKKLVKSNYFLYRQVTKILLYRRKLKSRVGGGNLFENQGCAKIIKDVIGSNNRCVIGEGTVMHNTRIRFRGNNNTIIFGENCMVGAHSSFWLEGNNITVAIGEKCTFTHTVHFCVQEDGMSVKVGKGCMFSNHITVRTSDGHPIYDENGNRINTPKSVEIGDNVWIAPDTKIMKGATIGEGAIIGSDSMVGSKPIPAHCLAVGHPAKVVKTDIKWTREQLFPQ